MPDKGYTVYPVYTENDQGQEVLTDMQVTSGNSRGVGRDGQVIGHEDHYYENSQGQLIHKYRDVELESDRADQGVYFNEGEYIEALIEANPEIPVAQQWCLENLPAEWIDEYNRQIESGSLDEMNQAVEWLLEQYAQRQDPTSNTPELEEMPEDPEMDELSEEETEILNNAVDELERQEAMPEYVDDWQEQVDIANESGDTTYAMVAAATAAFHAGEVTADEAINYCLNNGNLKDLARVYKHLTDQ